MSRSDEGPGAGNRASAILGSQNPDFMAGKTQLALKAVCAIYLNMVNKVASGTDEIFDIKWIKEKIHEQSNILAQHQLSSKNRIA